MPGAMNKLLDRVAHSSNPEFQEYTDQVARALPSHGYIRVTGNQQAQPDLAVCLWTGIGEPQKDYYEASSAIYERNIVNVKVGDSPSKTNPSSRLAVSTKSITEATTGLTGANVVKSQAHTVPRTVYTKHLSVLAEDLSTAVKDRATRAYGSAAIQPLWSVGVTTTGSAGNLHDVVPAMLAAAQPPLGTHADKAIRVKFGENDSRIKEIRGLE